MFDPDSLTDFDGLNLITCYTERFVIHINLEFGSSYSY